MNDFPLISVIVPVYGVEKYLDQCIGSIVNQTYQNLEIILVDDGSPDSCGAMCDAWAETDGRIHVIHQENAGAGAARNAGLDVAHGEIISMIDSDDYISPNMYAHLQQLMTDDVDIAECQIGYTQSNDMLFDTGCEGDARTFSMEEAMRLHIRDEVFRQTPPNKLYRKNTIQNIRFPVGNLIDDEFFTYRVIAKARKLVSSTACMYAYRQQDGSVMHKRFSLKRLQAMDAKSQRLAYLQEHIPSLVNEAKFDLFFTCVYFMQESMRYLSAEEMKISKKKIHSVLEEITPVEKNQGASAKKNILLKLAQHNFEGTCKLLNFLIDIHILT